MRPNITIGIAGHIDHGKTTLTKALTNIDTDRLIEEKRRKISIENGYAFLVLGENSRAAVIDVPGHERFIRQMIAGVAGIDLTLLVIAADEGVMPQTREHLDILRLLGIPKTIVVITKASLVEPDFLALVQEDIKQLLKGTEYETSPIYTVDSVTGNGICGLRAAIIAMIKSLKGRSAEEPFRLPIDDVFTLHGYGTIARGTIFNGKITMGSDVKLLPQDKPVRVKQLQVHHQQVGEARAGERVAVNLGGIDYKNVKRGNVLVDTSFYKSSKRLDVYLHSLKSMEKPLKQRGPVMVHVATSSVQGRVIFYDRNRFEAGDSIYAQLELEEPVVVKKGDRFVLRRPSPVETLGGGEIIAPTAMKHRFGEKTVSEIEDLAKGTPEEWVKTALSVDIVATRDELGQKANLNTPELSSVLESLVEKKVISAIGKESYVLTIEMDRMTTIMEGVLQKFHEGNPLRSGMNVAEWIHSINAPNVLIEAVSQYLIESHKVVINQHIVSAADFNPHLPLKWEKRLRSLEDTHINQGLQTENWSLIVAGSQLPESLIIDFWYYLIDSGAAFVLEEDRLIHAVPFQNAVSELKKMTDSRFTVQEAKEVLNLSRKTVIPFLELCDRRGLTKREDNERVWLV